MSNRLFTPEELEKMCTRPVDAAVQAVKDGNREELVLWTDKMLKAAQRSFKLRKNWDRGLTDKIYEKLGVEGIADVMKNCTFTEAQLKLMLVDEAFVESIIEAYDEGEKELAIDKIEQMYRMSMEFHDIRIKWENYLMGYIYDEISGDDLYEAMRKVVSSYNSAPIETAREGDFRKRVEQTIWGLHSHGQPLYAIEDDEKVSVYMNPCGSGQMLVESDCFSSPDKGRLVGPHKITWQLKNFPAYCVHAPIQEILSIEALGFPYFVNCPCTERNDPDWKFAHQSCAFSVYKDNNAIPEDVYKYLGMEKKHVDLQNHFDNV